MPNIKIIVATTKKYRMPKDPIYVPVQVGADLSNAPDLPYIKDNTGDNISEKNPRYCELTGLYWAWKNLDADYIGLVHYRRYFASDKKKLEGDPFKSIIRGKELEKLFEEYSVVVPEKRKYYIETLYSHYAHTHYEEQLQATRRVMEALHPEYIESYDRVMNRTSGYMFNMMIMRRDILDKYCEWLFEILAEIEKDRFDKGLSNYQGRYIGRISEIIFNVWMDYQLRNTDIEDFKVKELHCIHMESINWFKKGLAFIAAKVFHKKYKHSF